MKKSAFLVLSLFLLSVSSVFAQNQSDFSCFYFDAETDSANMDLLSNSANINCLSITGVNSAKSLFDIFDKTVSKQNIRKLKLQSYTGKTIPTNIKQFSNLEMVEIVNCPDLNFKKLFSNLKTIKTLVSLTLDDNESAEIPLNISQLDSLRILKITNYEMMDASRLAIVFNRMPLLSQLTLSSINRFEEEESLQLPENITSLDLSDNWLSMLPACVSNAGRLTRLDISENNFDEIDQVLRCLNKVPLSSLEISCQNRKDSAKVAKHYSNVDLQIRVYPDFIVSSGWRSQTKKHQRVPFIERYYTKNISPKVGDPQTVRKKFTVEATTAQNLYYSSGTELRIPDNAFIDASGKPVKGDVDIFYREFNDIVDVFSHGITMNYDSAGQEFPFQTSGMFEIYASQDTNQVFLAPGKKIELNYAIMDTSRGYNLYRLNPANGTWSFTSPLNNNFAQTTNTFSDAWRYYKLLNRVKFDTTLFNNRYADSSYCRIYKVDKRYLEGEIKYLKKHFRLKRISNPTRIKDLKKYSIFEMYFEKYYPVKEFAPYNGYKWVYAGNYNKKDFRLNIGRKKWTDMRVSLDADRNLFDIELKSPTEVVNIEAYPIGTNYKGDYSQYHNFYVKMDKRYQKALDRMQVSHDKRINKRLARHNSFYWKQIDYAMSPAEKNMTRDEWIAYAKKETEKQALVDSVGARFTNGLSIYGFGIYNCDRIYKIQDRLEYLAYFKDVNDNLLEPSVCYLIDLTRRSIITYPAYNGKSRIISGQPGNIAIYMLDKDGNAAIVDKNTVQNAMKEKMQPSYTFTATPINADDMKSDELRLMLGGD